MATPISTISDTFFQHEDHISRRGENPPPYSSTINYNEDVYFQSSGCSRALGPVKRRDIESGTGALAQVGRNRTIQLDETVVVLQLLFKFIGPQRYPTLLNESFETVCRLSRASEKYKVYAAMSVCSERMRDFGEQHSKHVLLYAAHNDYPHIFDAVAPRVVTSENLEYITPLLPDSFHVPWMKYNAQWAQTSKEISKHDPTSWYQRKSCWRDNCTHEILTNLAAGVHALGDLDKVFASQSIEKHTGKCESCAGARQRWRTRAEELIKEIGVFSNSFPSTKKQTCSEYATDITI